MRYLLISLSVCWFSSVYGQDEEGPERLIYSGTSSGTNSQYSSGKSRVSKRQYKKTFRYQFYKHHEDLVEDFYKRMKRNRRKYKKLERLMKKPQFSDPSYFGHKRKPKVRPVGKRKLCKECSIVH